jgi:hypothetical protein
LGGVFCSLWSQSSRLTSFDRRIFCPVVSLCCVVVLGSGPLGAAQFLRKGLLVTAGSLGRLGRRVLRELVVIGPRHTRTECLRQHSARMDR